MLKDYELVVFMSDWHIPYHDKKHLELVIDVLRYKSPDKIILGGDILDCYSLSSFDKDPTRMGKLQEEIDIAKEYFERIRSQNPDAEIIFLEGNHEFRLKRHLKKNPELYGLEVLTWPKLLNLDRFNIDFIHYDKGYVHKNFIFVHGSMVRKWSGYTAKGNMIKHGMSGITGHCHRMGTHHRRQRDGQYGFWENGCLCDMEPEYCDFPDWQQSITLVYFEKKGSRFHVIPCPIMDGEMMVGEKVYKVRE